MNLDAPKFHTVIRPSKKPTAQSRNPQAAQRRLALTHNLARDSTLKRGRGLKEDDGSYENSQGGHKENVRKRRKKVANYEYNSEDDIEERNSSLKMLFS